MYANAFKYFLKIIDMIIMVTFMRRNLSEELLKLIKLSPIGLTISDLSEATKASRVTILKYLQALKSKGLIESVKVGAYTLWTSKGRLETKRRLISKKLLCVLASSFLKIFSKNAKEIAFELGKNMLLEFKDSFPEEFELVEKMKGNHLQIASAILEFIIEDLRAEEILIEPCRGILRIHGELCGKEQLETVLIPLFVGAISELIRIREKKELKLLNFNFKEKGNRKFELILELEIG